MEHNAVTVNLHRLREQRLKKRLDQIESTMLFGGDVYVSSIVREYRASTLGDQVALMVRELVGHVDNLQKAFFVFGGENGDEIAREAVLGFGGEWPLIAGEMDALGIDALLTCDLSELPTALLEEQRKVVEAFFYCAVCACLCPAKDWRTGRLQKGQSVGKLRGIIRETTPLESGRPLAKPDDPNLEYPILGTPNKDDLFSLMDALYAARNADVRAEEEDPLLLPAELEQNQFTKAVNDWFDEVKIESELFGRYDVLCTSFTKSNLPQGAHSNFAMMWGTWLPSGFTELADEALEQFLGDRGLSRVLDDDLYIGAYDHLDMAKYEIDSELLRRMREQ